MSMPQTPEQMKAFNDSLSQIFAAHDPRFSGRNIVASHDARRTQRPAAHRADNLPSPMAAVCSSSPRCGRGTASWAGTSTSSPIPIASQLPDEHVSGAGSGVEGAEYDRLWAQIVAQMPFFTDHQAKIHAKSPS